MLGLYDKLRNAILFVSVVSGTGFALYTGAVGPFEPAVQRGVFVLIIMPLIFLLTPSRVFDRWPRVEAACNMALAFLIAGVMIYTLIHFKRLYAEPFLREPDIWVGWVGLVLVLETVRRTVGVSIAVILVGFLVFAYAGPSIPIDSLRHGGLDMEIIASQIFFGTDGVFGTPIAVVSTFIILIMLLGSLLTTTGGADMFMNLAKAVAGRYTGGPAKIAVIGSALMGMVTGATVANVATTGAVTIPMMKRAGYDPRFAGAVEALASSGGQLMPPIMGAAAFLMIDYLNIGYATLLGHALIPALLYFFCVMMIVHVRSVRYGLKAIPKSEIPSFWGELKRRGHMWLPIIVLVALLAQNLGIMYVAFVSAVTAMVVCQLRRETRLDLGGYYRTFRENIQAMIPLVAICAGAGIMIGALTATGLNLKITYIIDQLGGGLLLPTLFFTMIACLILGMGLPTVAAYVVLATLVPASLIKLGVLPVAAHMFIFYFAILSAVTPPVCTGAFVAAGIAQTNPMQTGIMAFKMSIPVFLLPYAFVYDPALLGDAGWIAVLTDTASAALGLAAWAVGMEGYLRRPLGMLARVAFMVSGGLMVWPEMSVSAAGFALAAAALATSEFARSRAAARSSAPEH